MNRTQAFEFYRRLAENDPAPQTELEFVNPYTLLVAVALSAQATDVGVNKATRALFAKVRTRRSRCSTSARTALKEHIKTIGLFNTKAKNVIAAAAHPGRRVRRRGPADRDALEDAARRRPQDRQCRAQRAPSAHPTIAVDTHIFRVGNRTGLARARPRSRSNSSSRRSRPQPFRAHAHHWLILHGRYICKARTPECWRCPVADLCAFKPKTPAPKIAKIRSS